jgi:hypothetical protein
MRVSGSRSSKPAWRRLAAAALAAAVVGMQGCSAIGGAAASGFADGLSAAILDEDDPDLVRDATPSYLIMLDALVRSDPDNERYLGAAAQLYAAYGVAFVPDAARAAKLTARSRDYGARALCAADKTACAVDNLDYDAFARVIRDVPDKDSPALYSYCVGSLAYIRGHSGDWAAIAALPKVEFALQHLLEHDAGDAASNNKYLGILKTLRPEALGGKPEAGRAYFEKAIELSGGRDLSTKVEYARGYARLVYDRELHDRLLNEVLGSPVQSEGLTLFNTLAQREARELLGSADDYF